MFSSWSHLLNTCLGVACTGQSKDITVALLDTSCTEEHVEMFLVNELTEARYTLSYYDDEWLVYGPISGPAYYTASLKDLNKQGLSEISKGQIYGKAHATAYELSIHSDTKKLTSSDVLLAYNVARVFNFHGVRGVETLVAITVDLVSWKLCTICEISEPRDYEEPDRWITPKKYVFANGGTDQESVDPRSIDPKKYFLSTAKVEQVCSLLVTTLEAEIAYLVDAMRKGHALHLVERKMSPYVLAIGHPAVMWQLLMALEDMIHVRSERQI